jgi:hypothetical protein
MPEENPNDRFFAMLTNVAHLGVPINRLADSIDKLTDAIKDEIASRQHPDQPE